MLNLMKLLLNKNNKKKEIKLNEFFDYGDGSGHGSGNGYDDGYGLGDGHGDSFGCGHLDGTGYG